MPHAVPALQQPANGAPLVGAELLSTWMTHSSPTKIDHGARIFHMDKLEFATTCVECSTLLPCANRPIKSSASIRAARQGTGIKMVATFSGAVHHVSAQMGGVPRSTSLCEGPFQMREILPAPLPLRAAVLRMVMWRQSAAP